MNRNTEVGKPSVGSPYTLTSVGSLTLTKGNVVIVTFYLSPPLCMNGGRDATT